MSKHLLASLIVSGFLSAPVFAGQCPNLMASIDEALAANTSSSEDVKTKVMELRTKGEEQHSSGQHAESIATLQEAKAMLGVE